MNLKHSSLLFLAGITFFTTTLAQPHIKDQGVIGGDKDDIFTCMYFTKDGGLIVGGYSNSNISAQKTENSRDSYDYWIIKLDSNAQIQWDKTIGGSSSDYFRIIQQTSDGGYILGGYSYSNISGDKTEDCRGYTDYWIVKLNSSGNIQWDKTIGGSDEDVLHALQQTIDGGYIVGGYSWSNVSGEKTENSRGGDDYWIVKLNSAGNIQWDKTIGGSYGDNLTALEQTTDGGYILGGISVSNISGEKTANCRGDNDYWIIKLDVAGNILWDKTLGGTYGDDLTALEQTADGGYILGGGSYSNKSGEKSQNSKGDFDYWLIRLDYNGVIQWDKTIGGSRHDYLSTLQQTTDGGYILAGYSSSYISGDKTENSRGGYDMWVVKTNGSGKVQWDKTIGGSKDDSHNKIVGVREIKRKRYVVGGSSLSGISGDKTGGNRGINFLYNDYWLVELRYVKPDSIAVASTQNTGKLQIPIYNSFTVYPNPASDKINIQCRGKATCTLTNQQGKTIHTITIVNSGSIDVSHVPAGVYFLTNTATSISQRIVVSR